METLAFIYFAFLMRVAYEQFILLRYLHQTPYKNVSKKLLKRSFFTILCWPIDFVVQPMIFLRAYILRDKVCLFILSFYYGKTS